MGLGEILVFWIGLALPVAIYASSKGRSAVGYFFLALLVSPLIAFAIVATANTTPEKEAKDTRAREKKQVRGGFSKKCPFCAEIIKAEAIVCKHCGRDMPGPKKPNPEPTGRSPHAWDAI